jgi:DHA1 family bicyclomycin/chloramphenicol resistance-like MFS transporter
MKPDRGSLYIVFLAAMPIIAAEGGVALSLMLWLAGFSVFLLVCGPLSDKYGRRLVLPAGLTLFTAATAACMLATNVVRSQVNFSTSKPDVV